MTALLLRLGILIAIFASAFVISQVVIGFSLDRRAELGAINRRLQLLSAGIDRDDVSVSLLKNAPPVLPLDASIWLRLYVGYIRMVMVSGVSMEARTLLIGSLIGSVGLFMVILLLALSANFALRFGLVQLVLVIALAIGVGFPMIVLSRMAQLQLKRMQDQFPEALDIFVRSLRAGHPVAAAIDLITRESEDPIGSEFGMVADTVAYGSGLTDALLAMADRWALEDMRMFVVCVSVQSETGGNLAEILENLSAVIRARASLFLKVRALSSEGRTSGWMLSLLPVFAFTVLFLWNPRFYLDVAQDPIFVIGFPALLVLYALGVLWIRNITNLKV